MTHTKVYINTLSIVDFGGNVGWYLMIKKAGNLQYLCKCIDNKDHIAYKGSGVYWRRYLKQHSDLEIETTVLGWYETPELLRKAGEYYSDHFDIVHDKSWANLIEEIGDGGPTVRNKIRAFCIETHEQRFFDKIEDLPDGWRRGSPNWVKTDIAKEKTRLFHLGRKRSEQTCENMRNATRRKRITVPCKTCGNQFTKQNIIRHENICEG